MKSLKDEEKERNLGGGGKRGISEKEGAEFRQFPCVAAISTYLPLHSSSCTCPPIYPYVHKTNTMSSSVLRNILAKPTNPAILPIPPRTTGNNVPKSLHKTRRFWRPNVTRSDWPVSIPAAFVPRSEALAFEYGESSSSSSAVVASGKRLAVKGVKMQMRRRKDVEKAGGIEGLLVSC